MRRPRTAYILILPSLFTTGNLFCGFYCIVRSIHHDFERAAYAIILAGVFDVLDGRVARMTRSQSQFGIEYDSIADVVSFGLAPALLSYIWLLEPHGRLGWVACFLFAACGALRLARFNTLSQESPKSYFVGLPIPAAANLVAGAVIAYPHVGLSNAGPILLGMMFILGLLMVSSVRYRSFKDFDLRHRRSFFQLVLLVTVLAIVMIQHELTLVLVVGYYVAWGPVQEAYILMKSRLGRKEHRTGNN